MRSEPSWSQDQSHQPFVRDLKQLNQPLQIRQIDPSIGILIQQFEGLPCLHLGITQLQGERLTPTVKADLSRFEPMRAQCCVEILHPQGANRVGLFSQEGGVIDAPERRWNTWSKARVVRRTTAAGFACMDRRKSAWIGQRHQPINGIDVAYIRPKPQP